MNKETYVDHNHPHAGRIINGKRIYCLQCDKPIKRNLER